MDLLSLSSSLQTLMLCGGNIHVSVNLRSPQQIVHGTGINYVESLGCSHELYKQVEVSKIESK